MTASETSARAVFEPKAIKPTDEQLAIQSATDRTIIVEANAGAAKTTTLALRMALVSDNDRRPDAWMPYTSPAQCNR